MRVPLSVFLIARNEEARLGRTLAAVGWADQIVVVDSGSTDETREIAREPPAPRCTTATGPAMARRRHSPSRSAGMTGC